MIFVDSVQAFTLQQSAPCLVLDTAPDLAPVDIDAMPYLVRGASLQVLVRSHFVVPEPEDAQGLVQGIAVADDQPVKLGFQGAEEAFDAVVLPRAMSIGSLMPNAQLPQREAEDQAVKDWLVVSTDGLGLAVLFDRVQQGAQDRDRGFVLEGLQVEAAAGAVVDYPEQEMLPAGASTN